MLNKSQLDAINRFAGENIGFLKNSQVFYDLDYKDLHYSMWKYIIDNYNELKTIKDLKDDWFKITGFKNVKNSCFLCEEYLKKDGSCDNCPLEECSTSDRTSLFERLSDGEYMEFGVKIRDIFFNNDKGDTMSNDDKMSRNDLLNRVDEIREDGRGEHTYGIMEYEVGDCANHCFFHDDIHQCKYKTVNPFGDISCSCFLNGMNGLPRNVCFIKLTDKEIKQSIHILKGSSILGIPECVEGDSYIQLGRFYEVLPSERLFSNRVGGKYMAVGYDPMEREATLRVDDNSLIYLTFSIDNIKSTNSYIELKSPFSVNDVIELKPCIDKKFEFIQECDGKNKMFNSIEELCTSSTFLGNLSWCEQKGLIQHKVDEPKGAIIEQGDLVCLGRYKYVVARRTSGYGLKTLHHDSWFTNKSAKELPATPKDFGIGSYYLPDFEIIKDGEWEIKIK